MPGMTLIEEIVVGAGGASEVDFDSIPADFAHLEIRYMGKTENAAAQAMYLFFNTDTTVGNYFSQRILGQGGSALASNHNFPYAGVLNATGASQPAHGRIEIPHYTNTDWRKGTLGDVGYHDGSQSNNDHWYLLWAGSGTPVIDRIRLRDATGSDIKEDSIFHLYGIPGASTDLRISDLTEATTLLDTDEFVLNASGTSKRVTKATLAAQLGGGYSPIDTRPSSPDAYDDEFDDSATLAGDWTAFGDAVTADIDTTVPGHFYLERNPLNTKMSGYHKGSITIPGTYMCAISNNAYVDFGYVGGLIVLGTGTISDSSPCFYVGPLYQSGMKSYLVRLSTLTTFAATQYNVPWQWGKSYFLLNFSSTSSVDVYYSADGYSWIPGALAYNPGWTMDKLGFGAKADSSTPKGIAMYDFIRRIA